MTPTKRTAKGKGRRGANNVDPNAEYMVTRSKRKAAEDTKNDKNKRSALADLTNNVKMHPSDEDTKNDKNKRAALDDLTINVKMHPGDEDTKNDKNKRAALDDLTNNVKMHPSDEDTKNDKNKRAALDDLTNNVKMHPGDEDTKQPKKPTTQQPQAPLDAKNVDNLAAATTPAPAPAATANKIMTPSLTKTEDAVENKLEEALPRRRSRSAVVTKTEDAVENKFEEALPQKPRQLRRSARLQEKAEKSRKPPTEPTVLIASAAAAMVTPVRPVPEDVVDFDRNNWDDPFQVSDYAMDIFNYLKKRETEFPIDDYMPKQIHLTTWLRTRLVDWLVKVQESFELNHETLYLAVKIVDLYLCRTVINKERMQLLGAAAFLIACKYDERQPPLIKDLLHNCDEDYTHDELIKMERETLRTINFNLGIPLSYRFLRRYARCAQVQMRTLTLARYILELSLMDYAAIRFSDSKMASAALFLAMRMDGGVENLNNQTWTSTLIYYTGYQLAEFAQLIPVLNAGLHRKPRSSIKTIRKKYSHKIFYKVSKMPLLTNEQIFESNLDLNDSNSGGT